MHYYEGVAEVLVGDARVAAHDAGRGIDREHGADWRAVIGEPQPQDVGLGGRDRALPDQQPQVVGGVIGEVRVGVIPGAGRQGWHTEQRVEGEWVGGVVDEVGRQHQLQPFPAQAQLPAHPNAVVVDAGDTAHGRHAAPMIRERKPALVRRARHQGTRQLARDNQIARATGFGCKHEALFDAITAHRIPFLHGAAVIANGIAVGHRFDGLALHHEARTAGDRLQRQVDAQGTFRGLAERWCELHAGAVCPQAPGGSDTIDDAVEAPGATGPGDATFGFGGPRRDRLATQCASERRCHETEQVRVRCHGKAHSMVTRMAPVTPMPMQAPPGSANCATRLRPDRAGSLGKGQGTRAPPVAEVVPAGTTMLSNGST